MGALNVAAAQASLVDRASSLADRATAYPLAVKALFVATLVLVLASIFVYALLFPTVAPDAEQAPASHEPAA